MASSVMMDEGGKVEDDPIATDSYLQILLNKLWQTLPVAP